MTEEKQGAAEWLREKARSIRRAEGFDCMQFMASEFGESCEGVRCADCYADLFERIAGRIDAEMVEYERLKKENAELKAELADWKGNAEGFQPDAYMKLPLDADGEPIRIGDKMNVDGDAMTVLGSIDGRDGCSVCDDCKQHDLELAWENEQWHKDEITCPWCGYSDPDSWEFEGEYDDGYECLHCGKQFFVEKRVDITYTSKRRIEDMPEGWVDE